MPIYIGKSLKLKLKLKQYSKFTQSAEVDNQLILLEILITYMHHPNVTAKANHLNF